MQSIADLRRDYKLQSLEITDVSNNPITQFKAWFDQANNSGLIEPNAMALATATRNGRPSVRNVLLKGVDERGFIFYTNFLSRKGKELTENPFASVCFHWDVLERQVRIEGSVEKLSYEESEAYFHSRPFKSQIGAMASMQSSEVGSRREMEEHYQNLLEKYEGQTVPMPDYWGGYIIKPDVIEFWQGRSGRMHDRLVYMLSDGNWIIKRLLP